MKDTIKVYMIGCVVVAICLANTTQPPYQKIWLSFCWPAAAYVALTGPDIP